MENLQVKILGLLSQKIDQRGDGKSGIASIGNIYFYGEACSMKFTRHNGEKVEIEFTDQKKMYEYIVGL